MGRYATENCQAEDTGDDVDARDTASGQDAQLRWTYVKAAVPSAFAPAHPRGQPADAGADPPTSAQMQNVIAQCGRNPTVLVAAPLERSSTSRSEPFVS